MRNPATLVPLVTLPGIPISTIETAGAEPPFQGVLFRRVGARLYDVAMELIHTCYRITDIDRSVAFYEALGFEERGRLPIGDEAVNVFMGLPGDADRLELTYNFGVDSYEIGTGYGHIALTVDDLDATLERLAADGIEPERPPYTVREGDPRTLFFNCMRLGPDVRCMSTRSEP